MGQSAREYGEFSDVSGCSPTLNTCKVEERQPQVITGIDKSYNNPKLIETA